jgi:hypothetical protein
VRVNGLLLEAKCSTQQLPESVQRLLLVAVGDAGAGSRGEGPLEVRQRLLQAAGLNLQSGVCRQGSYAIVSQEAAYSTA